MHIENQIKLRGLREEVIARASALANEGNAVHDTRILYVKHCVVRSMFKIHDNSPYMQKRFVESVA